MRTQYETESKPKEASNGQKYQKYIYICRNLQFFLLHKVEKLPRRKNRQIFQQSSMHLLVAHAHTQIGS